MWVRWLISERSSLPKWEKKACSVPGPGSWPAKWRGRGKWPLLSALSCCSTPRARWPLRMQALSLPD